MIDILLTGPRNCIVWGGVEGWCVDWWLDEMVKVQLLGGFLV